MRRIILCFCITIAACSPYKKVTLTKSEQLSEHWKNATAATVVTAMGDPKRIQMPDGYMLKFNYSYARVLPYKSKSGIQVRAAFTTQVNSITPRANDGPQTAPRSAEDSVIKYLEFYFDRSDHVRYVNAVGYPDSIYYVKRKA